MASFTEDQRIVIRALAAEEAQRELDQSPLIKTRVEAAVGDKLPRLQKLEKLLASWVGIVGIVLAVPFASAGATWALKSVLDKGVEQHIKSELNDERGPVKTQLNLFSKFRGNLSAQFEKSVDSATSKLLRFGCNLPPSPPIDGFPQCSHARALDSASEQARNVQELNDQTLVFKANENQRVLLRLRLSPVDDTQALARLGLRIEMPPLLSTAQDGRYEIKIDKKDLPDSHDYVQVDSGLLRLYGAVADRSDRETLAVDLDLTRHLRKHADVHALRLRSEPLEGLARAKGSERFYLHAIVIVTHHLPKD